MKEQQEAQRELQEWTSAAQRKAIDSLSPEEVCRVCVCACVLACVRVGGSGGMNVGRVGVATASWQHRAGVVTSLHFTFPEALGLDTSYLKIVVRFRLQRQSLWMSELFVLHSTGIDWPPFCGCLHSVHLQYLVRSVTVASRWPVQCFPPMFSARQKSPLQQVRLGHWYDFPALEALVVSIFECLSIERDQRSSE